MDSPTTPTRPTYQNSQFTPTDTAQTNAGSNDIPREITIDSPTTTAPRFLTDAETEALPEAPRPRAETATSADLRNAFIAPIDRLNKLNDDIATLLADFEDSAHPRLPECVYDGLRRCANEMETLLTFQDQPHIMGSDTIIAGDFQPETTTAADDETSKKSAATL